MLNTVFANDIRQTLDTFRRSVDQFFENAYGYPVERGSSTPADNSQWTFSPVLETAWDDSSLHLRAILPGVREGDVNVNLQGNQLAITGERKLPEGFRKNAYTQLSYGKFTTSLALPNGLNLDQVRCQLHDGVLDIEIPIAETMKARQVPIQSGSQQKAIHA